MDTENVIKYKLLENLLEKGLPSIAEYFSEVTDHLIVICDHAGRIYFSPMNDKPYSKLEDQYVGIPLYKAEGGNYFYDKNSSCLYFCVGSENAADAYIVVYQVDSEEIPLIVPHLKEAHLAVRCYFANIKSAEVIENDVKTQLLEDFLFNNNARIREILKLTNRPKLDINQLYYIGVLEPETEVNIDTLYSYSKEWLVSRNYSPICSKWMNSIIMICPVHFNDQTLEIDWDWNRHYMNINQHKKDMEKKFNTKCSIGIGEKYTLTELHKSYTEAKTALTVSRLMGQKSFIKRFADLGLFSLLNKLDIEDLKEYCEKTLGNLIQYDKDYNGELLPALRSLFDSNMNWKETAGSMFIHVNTLRYRMNKIEELLEIDLSKIETQANLFVALKIFDSLKANGFLDSK